MSNTTKPSNQEIFYSLACAISHQRSAEHQFGVIFPRRFHVHEIEPGKYHILEELPNRVMRYVEEDAVSAALQNFCEQLPEEPWAKHYRLDTKKCESAMRYWRNRTQSLWNVEKNPIHAVLKKSAPGYCFHRLDFDSMEMATPLFDDFLAHIVHGADAFLAWNGSLFDMSVRLQQYLYMQGPGGDGKGTWINFLRRLLGKSVASVTAGKHLENDRFLFARFLTARLGVFPDLHDPRFVTKEMMMMLTGGDPVFVEKKGKDGATMELPTQFLVSSNQLPDISGSEAHRRRAVICQFQERKALCGDPLTYLDRMWEERAGIVWKLEQAWERHKKEAGRVIASQEIITEVVESSEAFFDDVLEKHFSVNMEMEGDMTQGALATFLREERKWNDFDIGKFKRFLSRRGIIVKQRTRDGKRIVAGLHFRKKHDETMAF
jgi:hypothetical protein